MTPLNDTTAFAKALSNDGVGTGEPAPAPRVRQYFPETLLWKPQLITDDNGKLDPLPIELERLESVGAVMDLVYGLAPTSFVRAAEALGVPAADGAEMLVQQGAAAFERWWGESAPVAVMRGALASARSR